jgi:hypothetical protein
VDEITIIRDDWKGDDAKDVHRVVPNIGRWT